MQIALLGPFEARDDTGRSVEIRGRRLRTLLARLALDPGHLVTTESLIDAIWGEQPPHDVSNALHSLVSRLRRALPPHDAARLESLEAGYRLSVAADATDIARFERLAAEGRACRDAGKLQATGDRFGRALALWRGTPLADLAEAAFAGAAVARLTELRLRTVADQAELALASGRADGLIADLRQLSAEHPLDERLGGLQIRALHAAGRTAEALSAFEDLRRSLADTLGSDPSPALRELHTAMLHGSGPDPGAPQAPDAGQTQVPAVPRTNLRAAVTSFVGREQELDQIGGLLDDDARLVTLVGPGGVGKTRLAAQVAAGRAEPDGSWLVELAEIRDGSHVLAAIVDALGLRPASWPSDDPGPALLPLRDRRLLIVLDNCEHLLGACARIAHEILTRCPGVRILATSREPLAITGERLYPVGPLPVPAGEVEPARALGVPALQLFADRAAAVRFGFRLTAENLPAVTGICRSLDGLPLAIELACARLRTLPADEIAARLGDRFRLLTGGSRAALPRHRTLRAVIEWSWELFTEQERTLGRRLAVFAGGVTPEAAEAVCADESLPARGVLDLLGALADRSFVELREPPGAPAHYRMLDTIRAYAAAALAEAGESDRFRRAHARYFLARAEAAEPLLRTRDQMASLAWLRREHDNIGAALRYAIDAADTETAVRLAAALGWYWSLHGSHGEAAGWLREILALPGAEAPGRVPRQVLAAAYAYDAMHHFAVQDVERAVRSASRASELASGDGGTPHPATVFVAAMQQHVADAGGFADLAASADPWISAAGELFGGFAAEIRGDAAAAARLFAAARDKFTAIGDGWGAAGAVRHLGIGHGLGGDHRAAIAALDQAIRFTDAVGAEDDGAWMRVQRGIERLRAGDLVNADADLARARTAGQALRSAAVLAFAEAALGERSRQAGDLAQARSLLTAARGRLDGAPEVPARVRILPLTGLARLAVTEGQLGQARGCLVDALAMVLAAEPPAPQDRPAIAAVAEAVAELALADGQPAAAARLLGCAAAVRGVPDQGDPDVRRTAAAARAALADYDAAYGPAAQTSADAAVGAVMALAGQLTGLDFGAGPGR